MTRPQVAAPGTVLRNTYVSIDVKILRKGLGSVMRRKQDIVPRSQITLARKPSEDGLTCVPERDQAVVLTFIENYRHIVVGSAEGVPGQSEPFFKIVGQVQGLDFREVRYCLLILPIQVDDLIPLMLQVWLSKYAPGIIRVYAWPFEVACSPEVIIQRSITSVQQLAGQVRIPAHRGTDLTSHSVGERYRRPVNRERKPRGYKAWMQAAGNRNIREPVLDGYLPKRRGKVKVTDAG